MAEEPRKKLVDRFEVVGVQTIDVDKVQGDQNWSSVYDAVHEGGGVRVYILHYPTHFDARLGASGLRIGGITIMGITDLHTGERMVET